MPGNTIAEEYDPLMPSHVSSIKCGMALVRASMVVPHTATATKCICVEAFQPWLSFKERRRRRRNRSWRLTYSSEFLRSLNSERGGWLRDSPTMENLETFIRFARQSDSVVSRTVSFLGLSSFSFSFFSGCASWRPFSVFMKIPWRYIRFKGIGHSFLPECVISPKTKWRKTLKTR